MSDVSNVTSALSSYTLKATDWVYGLCFYAVGAFSLALLFFGAITLAVSCNIVDVPEFHPR